MTDTNLVEAAISGLGETNAVDVLTPATSLVNQLLDVSPPVAMALSLSCLYAFAVSYTRINKLLLDLLVIVGASALFPQLADPGKVGFAVHNPVLAEIVTGSLIGCAAIIVNPAFRRLLAKLGALGDADAARVAAANACPTPPSTKDPNAPTPPPTVPPAV